MRTLVWFRGKDVRLHDHAPLADAVGRGDEIVPLFVVDPYFFAPSRARELPHRMQFLIGSVRVLADQLAERGSRLLFASGRSVEVVPELARRLRADRVVAQRWTEPFARERDRRIQAALNVPFELFDGETLLPPASVRSSSGQPYRVFSAFARACHVPDEQPLPAPARLPALPADLTDCRPGRAPFCEAPTLAASGLSANPHLLASGEPAARQRLERFLEQSGPHYHELRDRLDLPGTSRLSQDLKFGLLSPRTVWTRAAAALERSAEALARFHDELLWREFAYACLWDDPELLERPFHREYESFPWADDPGALEAWKHGQTGYPVVDAACRQLLAEGFVPNRGRMIAASFLTKHLFVHSARGEAHYLEYMTDGDWANNNLGWQWSAGSGPDAQPYFRVFNPVLQGKKFDPDGSYVRRWIPELARLPAAVIHAPWAARPQALRAAGVELGKTYPLPFVDHAVARRRYLVRASAWMSER